MILRSGQQGLVAAPAGLQCPGGYAEARAGGLSSAARRGKRSMASGVHSRRNLPHKA